MKRLILAAVVAASFANAAYGQSYPEHPIKLVVPFPAGGIADSGGRMIAKTLARVIGKPVVVDNKGGAGGVVGAEAVANAKPDGYTLLQGSNTALISAQYLLKKLSYNPEEAFKPVYGVSITPLMIAVRADAPYKTLAELVEYAKKNPEKINFATIGQGSTHHLLAELFQREAGIKMTHIPYKGATPALTDFLGGSIDLFIDYQLGIAPLVESGKIIALAVASDERLPTMPKTPTFAEQGYKSVVVSAFTIVLAPADTPQPILDKLVAAFPEVLKDPEMVKYYADRGSQMMLGYGPAELRKFLDEERAKTKKMIELSGLQPE
jgi:tripartite-type tricarboxylate transporter receptor subunit TctC